MITLQGIILWNTHAGRMIEVDVILHYAFLSVTRLIWTDFQRTYILLEYRFQTRKQVEIAPKDYNSGNDKFYSPDAIADQAEEIGGQADRHKTNLRCSHSEPHYRWRLGVSEQTPGGRYP